MSYMFSGCNSLNSLPDISKWDTSNVIDMKGMFSGCSLLNKLNNYLKIFWYYILITSFKHPTHISNIRCIPIRNIR